MTIYHTTGDLAKVFGISGTAARNKIASGEWKPSARTKSGEALFSEARVAQIATTYVHRQRSAAVRATVKAQRGATK